ncbi:hypothetical protein B0H13DRAFT_1919294 [Mycena leptocephala]|nr:hypothetical protein B0H13DRAFT_1919294 [Mycena leptocephala]
MSDITALSDLLGRANLLGTDFDIALDEHAVKMFPESELLDDYLEGIDLFDTNIKPGQDDGGPIAQHTPSMARASSRASSCSRANPGVRTRKQRSADCKDAYHTLRMAQTPAINAPTTVAGRAAKMRGYAGPHGGGARPGKSLIEIDLRNGGAVSVYDANGIKTVHRANLAKNPAINDACSAAGQIVKKAVATYGTKQACGKFHTFIFSLHRGSCAEPRMSKDVSQQPETYQMLKKCLEPVRKVVESKLNGHACSRGLSGDRYLQAEFPALYEWYKHTAEAVASKVPGRSLHSPLLHPSASTSQQLGAWCTLTPPGTANWWSGSWAMSSKWRQASQFFFPSALYTHYNTRLVLMGMRGSIVAWMGASIFQYVDLGCRVVRDLSAAELREYRAGLKERVRKGFDLFPRRRRPAALESLIYTLSYSKKTQNKPDTHIPLSFCIARTARIGVCIYSDGTRRGQAPFIRAGLRHIAGVAVVVIVALVLRPRVSRHGKEAPARFFQRLEGSWRRVCRVLGPAICQILVAQLTLLSKLLRIQAPRIIRRVGEYLKRVRGGQCKGTVPGVIQPTAHHRRWVPAVPALGLPEQVQPWPFVGGSFEGGSGRGRFER